MMDASEKLQQDLDGCRKLINSHPVATRNPELTHRLCNEILPAWGASMSPTVWRKVRKLVPKEWNESEPIIVYMLDRIAKQEETCIVVDICSGFGIASMILSVLLGSQSRVKRICLLDYRWPCKIMEGSKKSTSFSSTHIEERDWPVPLRVRKVDMKRSRDRAQLPTYVFHDYRVLFMGIHLCKALSVHAIHLWHDTPKRDCLVLKPCCLPGSTRLYVGKKPIVYEFRNGYSFRPLDVYNGDGEETAEAQIEDQAEDVAEVETQVEENHNISDNEEYGTHTFGGGMKNNKIFNRWVDQLACACEGPTCRVRNERLEIQKRHFQNQIIFCEQIV